MTTPKEARAALASALTDVDGVRFYADMSATVDPPATVVGPPALSWEAHCSEPTAATFVVYLMVTVNERTIDRLLDLLPAVTEALETVDEAVVVSATPGVWIGGGPELPCFEILTEVSL